MTTTIRIGRKTPFTKSDTLREDETLYEEAQKLGAWLETKDIAVVTMAQVLTQTKIDHPEATLVRETVWYEWVWNPDEQMYVLKCHDRGTISFLPEGDTDPIQIRIEISAGY
jgi:hypothetical protein